MTIGDGDIGGKKDMGQVYEEMARVIASGVKKVYQSKEFALSGAQTDYDFAAGQSAFGTALPRAHTVIIRTDVDISVKFNDAGNDAITITAGEGVFTISAVEVTNIFITQAGSSNLKIILA